MYIYIYKYIYRNCLRIPLLPAAGFHARGGQLPLHHRASALYAVDVAQVSNNGPGQMLIDLFRHPIWAMFPQHTSLPIHAALEQ